MKKTFSFFITIFIVVNSVLSQTNDFKIGIFGFSYMTATNFDCSNLNYKPITTTMYNGHPSSQGNVLSSDGFNIVINYQPDMYNSTVTFMSALLDLVKNNKLQYYSHARYFFKPNTNCIEGTNVYNNNGGGANSICRARPNFDELYANVYSNSNYKNVVWGHHITEEASYNHPFNPTDNFIGWDDPQNCFTEVPPTNVSNAIGYFRQKQNSLSISNQKLVAMEANHHKNINDNTNDGQGSYNPQDYLKIQNKPDVFLEGSYTQFPEDGWLNQNYSAISTPTGYHYLGPLKSIDYAYTKVNEVQKVINTEINNSNYEHHYHSQLAIKNANWLWFQAYTSIIHNSKGIWFWDLSNSWRSDETRATGADRFELYNFSDAYKNYIRHLARELRFLVNKNILTTDNTSVLASKTDIADPNGIVPVASSYIPASLPSEKRTENYGLRYTIRTNGNEVIMIITNPLNVAVTATLDFTKFSNQIIRNSNQVEFLFEDNSTPVTSSTYKTNRNSTINLTALTVSKKYTQSFNGTLSVSFGPMDVHVIKFSGSTGWNENVLSKLQNTVMPFTQIKYGNGQMFYVRADGIIHSIWNGKSDDWVNPNAPKVKSNGGFEIVPSNNNEIYYVGTNNQIYRMYWNGSSWSYELPISASLNVANYSELHYGNGQLFYIRNDGIIHAIYKSGSSWVYNWLNGSAPKANSNCGFELIPQNNNEIYYVGTDGKIYRMYWTSSNGWSYESTSTAQLNVQEHSELHYGNGHLFYVRNDGVIHALYKSNNAWVYNWLNPNAPKVKAGTGFVLLPEQNNTIYYIGTDSYIYKMYWTSSSGWVYTKINQTPSNLSGAKENSDIVFGNNQLFYVGLDSRVHNYSFVNTLPFSITSSNSNTGNSWDVQGADGSDIGFLIYLPSTSKINATTCSSITNYDTKLEIFKLDGTRTSFYNDNYTCNYNQYFSTISGAQLNPGYYYVVVDGYNGAFGNFNLSVSLNTLKSASVNQPNIGHVIGNDEDLGKYGEQKINSTTSINSLSTNNSSISIFPNPVSTDFKIKSSDGNLSQVSVLDLQGRIIYQYNGSPANEVEVNCSGIISGVYIVKVLIRDEIKTYKLSINKK